MCNKAGRSETFGGELAIEGDVSEALSLFGAVAVVETEFKEFEDADGNAFPFASPLTVSLGGRYAITPEWSIAVDASYTAAAFQDVENSIEDDSRWLLNAELTYENEDGLLVWVYGRNLLDETYADFRSEFVDQFGVSPGFDNIVRIGEPCTLGAFVQKTF
ncbi:TonB-dependent receptor [Cognatiyoonia sp. IB215182]|uniref:TonB-dependent receptor n=1 Tax=Cognatiyoonia sp. IB215182 TaxID=3097353 RepID=UPI002A0ADB29|nr:TonB-dependent receptor [Cognatiyoonia sp. IB215182]MDX8354770.1 TonB-dependent receptor [Cognatiyoonia sp. IB215182]